MWFAVPADPALAQASASIEVKSDDRYRGRSLSGGKPVIEIDYSLDTESGLYLGGSTSATLTGEDRAGLQGAEIYVGYTTEIVDGLSLDSGVIGYAFTDRYSGNQSDQFGEVYLGVNARNVALYVHYTPNYFDRSVPVLYTSASTSVPLGDGFSLSAKAGLLAQTSGPPRLRGREWRYDTRLALSRPFAGFDTQLAWTYAGPDDAYFEGPWEGRSALVLRVAKYF